MKEVIEDIDRWLEQQQQVAVATVIQTWGSAPRREGAKMAMTPGGEISGSVSGGCVEGAVVEEGTAVLATERPKLLHYGVADETAWDVGLACGGTIELFVEPLAPEMVSFTRRLLQENGGGAMITIIQGAEEQLGRKLFLADNGERQGTLSDALDGPAIAAAGTMSGSRRLWLNDEVEIFIDQLRPAPTLIMVGGVHIAVALTAMARILGFATVVIDPRRAFGSETRFSHANQLIQAWPQKAFAGLSVTRDTAVALLTHDPKIDDPALEIVLPSDAFYIGALGSRKTHARRVQRLRDSGISQEAIERIHAPIGLAIEAQTPEEIALSVIAEIIEAYRRRVDE